MCHPCLPPHAGVRFGKPIPSAEYFGVYGIPSVAPARPRHACASPIPALAASGGCAAAAAAAAAANWQAPAHAAQGGQAKAGEEAGEESQGADKDAQVANAGSSASVTHGSAAAPVAEAQTVGLGLYRQVLGQEPASGYDCLLTSEGLPPLGPPLWMPKVRVQRNVDPQPKEAGGSVQPGKHAPPAPEEASPAPTAEGNKDAGATAPKEASSFMVQVRRDVVGMTL